MFTKKRLFYALIYSSILPVTASSEVFFINIIGILITFPFALGAWAGGEQFAYMFNHYFAFHFGAALGIFVQVMVLLYLVQLLSKAKKHLTSKSTRTKNSWL